MVDKVYKYGESMLLQFQDFLASLDDLVYELRDDELFAVEDELARVFDKLTMKTWPKLDDLLDELQEKLEKSSSR
jgi:hypothetical protein